MQDPKAIERLGSENLNSDPDPDLAKALRRDMLRLQENIVAGAVMRSAPQPTPITIGSSAISQIGEGLSKTGLPILSAALFYAQRDGELAIYMVGSDKTLLASAVVPVTAAQLEDAVFALRVRLGVDAPGISRAPQPRTRGIMRPTPPSASGEDPARRLADMLLPQAVRDQFKNHGAVQIIGNGVIAAVPFAMLPLDDKRVVMDEAFVVVASNLSEVLMPPPSWKSIAEWPDEQLERALFVGNPLVPRSSKWRVADLPGAAVEAKQLSARLRAKPLIGAAATKSVIQQRMPESSLIHIAAHGVSNPANPLDGGLLMLSGSDEASAFLTAREVQQMRLSASLVILSACQSGLGLSHKGGMIGLSRAFRIAGVPRIAMTLWSVDDAATLFLMQRFQHHLFAKNDKRFTDGGPPDLIWPKGTPPGEAMRRAQIDTRELYPHPKFWAGFTMFGMLN